MSEPITLVTAALPYANGSIHIGHLVEYLMADIYVRALRMAGKKAFFICADDTHGTPIEVSAKKAGMSPEAFVARFSSEHVRDFSRFDIRFDHYDSTNSEENRRWVHEIYAKLRDKGHITRRSVDQFYDETAGRFLPDRFVRGTCPNPACRAPDQYGDVCEVCQRTYEPTDLADATSALTGTKPVIRSSEHLFVALEPFTKMLSEWVDEPGRLQPDIRKFVRGWIDTGLRDWCISRDAPYFGFEIPDVPGKYFYVWLDAPVGYISSTENFARQANRPELADEIWRRGGAKIVHIIGRDIIYFHALFWPAMLHAADLATPNEIHVHGMLTVDGVKMSKTRGTFINAATYLDVLDPIYLRYYFASKMSSSSEDLDLALDEFVDRVNADLVNKLANLVSRGVAFLRDKLDGRYGSIDPGAEPQLALVRAKVADAEKCYGSFDIGAAVRIAVELAELGNKLFQDGAPWALVKSDRESANALVTLCLNIARAATVVVAPAVPAFARAVYPMLGLVGEPASFAEGARFDLVDRAVGPHDRIVNRIQRSDLDAIVRASIDSKAESKPQPTESNASASSEKKKPEPSKKPVSPARIGIDDFARVDLRVGVVLEAKAVEGADKLLELSVDVGEDRPRTVFAGIRTAYEPKDVVGLRVAVVANLEPRKMRFGTSEGMLLAGGPGGKDIWLLTLSPAARPGEKIA